MFAKRIIPCLDVHAGRVVKGVNFVNLRDAGDPVEIAKIYNKAGADELVMIGLELPLSYYKKGVETPLAPDELSRCLGEPDASRYQILLAHTPKYIPEYFAWGADLCLSGHYHGGLVCIPGIGSVVSPQFELLPKYSFGRFDEGTRTALVSRGMGTHTFHIRIFNRSELLVVTAKPEPCGGIQ